MKCTGSAYTWSNRYDPVNLMYLKIDRTFINHETLMTWDDMQTEFLAEGPLITHQPLLLFMTILGNLDSVTYGWTVMILIICRWRSGRGQDRGLMLQLCDKLQKLKNKLKFLQTTKYADVHTKVDVLRTKLYDIQKELHKEPLNATLQELESKVREEYGSMVDASLELLRQQSKIE
ncbi:LOW QUALITY PROTEIN: hypothetical protein Cgig2_010884 [Carnegiea gigantea]|uniref:Uncharacterized protein n=1 Tax=Carnegiea gigantea TaxID=171969 RepID=A0A9Q1JJB2_9CARY|nr:LOW QUALITY PROTEIN: hypothetical protein Cgig2_010884 [Carnegiea gigantea]